jgi:sucrose-6-phosphate hydrolase SacC (GH32 family)
MSRNFCAPSKLKDMKATLLLLMAILTATVTPTLTSAVKADEGGYLFVTFKGEQSPMSEQIYFAISKDGKRWQALNGEQPVLTSSLGEKGLRDPFLVRSPNGKKFFLIATDLSINLNHDWGRAVRNGSKSIMIWESKDLVRWSEPRLVRVAADDAGCTWAPEAVYDEKTKDYLVFWASTNASDGFKKHRIWAARTKDFRTFGQPFIYIEKPTTVIDTTIVRENGKYFRFSKDEQFKAITMEQSENLMGPWTDVPNFSLSKLRGYEGPECYRIEPATKDKPATWCLILDHYAEGKGYQPYITHDLKEGSFAPGEEFHFPFRFRHGSVLSLTPKNYRDLEKAFGQPQAVAPTK